MTLSPHTNKKLSPPQSKGHSLPAHDAHGNWTGNFMRDKRDGVHSQTVQGKPWMSLSDLTLVSQKREREAQDIWTTDVKCNPPLSTTFVLL